MAAAVNRGASSQSVGPARLAGVLDKIMGEQETWPAVAAAAKARAAEFTMEKIARKYLDAFHAVLPPPGVARA